MNVTFIPAKPGVGNNVSKESTPKLAENAASYADACIGTITDANQSSGAASTALSRAPQRSSATIGL